MRIIASLITMLALTACNPEPASVPMTGASQDDTAITTDDTGEQPDQMIDADEDEIPEGIDCDDTDPDPNASLPSSFWRDADGDGYGDPEVEQSACEPPEGFVDNYEDCNDSEGAINPSAVEYCDQVDNDCSGEIDDADDIVYYFDTDADGFGNPEQTYENGCVPQEGVPVVSDNTDCDDTDAEVNPNAIEICDGGVDNDCNGLADDADEESLDIDTQTTWYLDADIDGHGDPSNVVSSCEQPDSYITEAGDCDDTNSAIHPDALEECDGQDNNCDGVTDEDDAIDADTWYEDADADGYGNTDSTDVACDAPTGFVSDDTDCDDTEATTYPGADEYCDEVDNDCDGDIDEDSSVDAGTWNRDSDGDTYGDPSVVLIQCEQPDGYIADDTDCDDGEADANPGMTEVCDSIDNDCDGDADEDDATDASTWYLDTDGDTYGDASSSDIACDQPTGYVADDTDCDDTNSIVNPAATEMCDSIDNDCDGTTDEDDAADADTWYLDSDADGFGTTSSTDACSQPSGYADNSDDCDDADGAINPDAEEVCDDVDNDCDSSIDEEATDAVTYYPDLDSDGYGNASGTSIDSCDALSGYVTDDTDCDDGEADANPGMTEVCDSIDNDCDGDTDEADASDASTWYADSDSDGYGDATSTDVACDAPTGFVSDDTDCDDTDSDNNPGATEVCDGEDNDCDSSIDEGLLVTYYADSDSDGFGDSSVSEDVCSGSQSSGYITDDSDCDDTDATISPLEDEVCDSVDNDCDGTVDEDDAIDADTWHSDSDGDGYGDSEDEGYTACDPAVTTDTTDSSDCDDLDASVSPDALEYCDSIDNNCDGDIDEDSAVDTSYWYLDADADTYGDASNSDLACDAPTGFVSDDTDCDDNENSVNPGATEVCDTDDTDEDCDGLSDDDDPSVSDQDTWYDDGDTDGYGDPSDSETSCDQPEDHVEDSSDCDDTNGTINPGVDEVCDSVDNDCDGETDESDATDALTWYEDSDLDGYGNASSTDVACDAPTGYVSDATDCDDSDADQNPAASESCNDEDDDCDGTVDEGVETTWYSDSDGDGYGDDSDSGYEACSPTSSSDVADNTDCDDLDDTINPDAIETCDEVDEDCDGTADDGASESWYQDDDGDGYGAGTVITTTCDSSNYGLSSVDTDCDDDNASANPGVTSDDDCDGEDSDCDGTVDEDATCEGDTGLDTGDFDTDDTGSTCTDADGDDWCVEDGDCDDTDASINPDAVELDDELDNDCDGLCDEGIDGDATCD